MSQRALKVSRWLSRFGVSAAARHALASPGRSRYVLVLHGVAARRYDKIERRAQPPHDRAALRATLTWLHGHGYAFLTPDAFFESDEPGVLLTFDDGLANNFHHALPELEAFAAPAIFFIATQHIAQAGNWLPASREIALRHWQKLDDVPHDMRVEFYDGMRPDQVAACAAHPLITVAAHTVSHPFLTRCDSTELRREITEDRALLESITRQPVTYFAYPTGDYDRRVAEAVRDVGYEAAFAVDVRVGNMPRFEVPRVGLYESDPAYLAFKLSGLQMRPLPAQAYDTMVGGGT